MDLLTVIMHELGHTMGLDHSQAVEVVGYTLPTLHEVSAKVEVDTASDETIVLGSLPASKANAAKQSENEIYFLVSAEQPNRK